MNQHTVDKEIAMLEERKHIHTAVCPCSSWYLLSDVLDIFLYLGYS